MKKAVYLFSIFFFANCMTGCLDWAQSHYTPQVGCSQFIKNTTDTLGIDIDSETGYTKLDTIAVGDEVKFIVTFNALSNNLLGAQINTDTTLLSMTYGPLDDIASAMLPESDPANGQFFFADGYMGVRIPVTFVAKKAGSYKLEFIATSDSKYSPATYRITGNVK
ncbi:MAG: hypothetical protein ACI3Z5_04025 [Paludibacteraceae bacterium]